MVKVYRAYRLDGEDAQDAPHVGGLIGTLGYDGLGRRIVKKVENSGDWNGEFRYYYDDQQLIEVRRDYGGTLGYRVVKQYVWGTQYVDELLAVAVNTDPEDSAETHGGACERWFWALTDVNYNVVGLTGTFGGTASLFERYEYTPYGERTVYSRNFLQADVDEDGDVDQDDVDLVGYGIGAGDPNSRFDLDGDGDVDTDDQQWATDAMNAGQSLAADDWVRAPRIDSTRGVKYDGTALLPVDLCDVGHQGLIFDKEWGRYGTPTRTYTPALARWDSPDYAGGFVDGPNLYQAYLSNPINKVDPQGTWGRNIHEDLTYALAMAAGFNHEDAETIGRMNNDVDHRQRIHGGYLQRVAGWWWQQIMWEVYHLPGACAQGGDGRVGQDNPVTQRILRAMRDAAHQGWGDTGWIEGYAHHLGAEAWQAVVTPEAQYTLTARDPWGPNNRATRIEITPYIALDRRGRLNMLAAFLHSLQDSFAHEGGRTGHEDWTDPRFDDPWRGGPGDRTGDTAWMQLRTCYSRAQDAARETYTELVQFLDDPLTAVIHGTYRSFPSLPYNAIVARVDDYLAAVGERQKRTAYERLLDQIPRVHNGQSRVKPFETPRRDWVHGRFPLPW